MKNKDAHSRSEQDKKILDSLINSDLSEGMSEKIREWYVSSDRREEKDAALRDIFENSLTENLLTSGYYVTMRR